MNFDGMELSKRYLYTISNMNRGARTVLTFCIKIDLIYVVIEQYYSFR